MNCTRPAAASRGSCKKLPPAAQGGITAKDSQGVHHRASANTTTFHHLFLFHLKGRGRETETFHLLVPPCSSCWTRSLLWVAPAVSMDAGQQEAGFEVQGLGLELGLLTCYADILGSNLTAGPQCQWKNMGRPSGKQ